MTGSDLSGWAARHTLNLMIGIAVVSVLLGATVAGLFMRSCSVGPTLPQEPVGIDAGPGEALISERLDAAVQADEEQIQQLEDRNARSIAQMTEEQQAEYASVRRGGRHAVARWLSDYNTELKTDSGVAP